MIALKVLIEADTALDACNILGNVLVPPGGDVLLSWENRTSQHSRSKSPTMFFKGNRPA